MNKKIGKTLYLGTSPSAYDGREDVFCCPIIEVVPKEIPFYIAQDMEEYTHFIFTSKNSLSLFSTLLQNLSFLRNKKICVIGKETAKRCQSLGIVPTYVAKEETQEGMIDLLLRLDLQEAYVLFPKSSLARQKLENFFIEKEIRYQAFDLYDTVTKKPDLLPELDHFDEIVFTSPSTVQAFIDLFAEIPKNKKLTCLGPITKEALKRIR